MATTWFSGITDSQIVIGVVSACAGAVVTRLLQLKSIKSSRVVATLSPQELLYPSFMCSDSISMLKANNLMFTQVNEIAVKGIEAIGSLDENGRNTLKTVCRGLIELSKSALDNHRKLDNELSGVDPHNWPQALWITRIANKGNVVASAVRLEIPGAFVASLIRSGSLEPPRLINNVLDLGDMQPGEEISVSIWSKTSPLDVRPGNLRLRCNEGVCKIIVLYQNDGSLRHWMRSKTDHPILIAAAFFLTWVLWKAISS